MNKLPFSVSEGLATQEEHLAVWKTILKPEVFSELENQVQGINFHAHYKDGYDVCRGDSINQLVLNIAQHRSRKQQS